MTQYELTPLGFLVKKTLREKGMTQVELAEEIGITKQHLYSILYGKRPPGKYLSELERFCYSTLSTQKEGKNPVNWQELTPFGLMVTKALRAKEMTQVELAKELGTTKQYLNMIFHGKRSGGKYLSKIADICEIDLETEISKTND